MEQVEKRFPAQTPQTPNPQPLVVAKSISFLPSTLRTAHKYARPSLTHPSPPPTYPLPSLPRTGENPLSAFLVQRKRNAQRRPGLPETWFNNSGRPSMSLKAEFVSKSASNPIQSQNAPKPKALGAITQGDEGEKKMNSLKKNPNSPNPNQTVAPKPSLPAAHLI